MTHKYYYYNQGLHRKNQIYNWLNETINDDSFLRLKFREIIILIKTDKINLAANQFKELIEYIVTNQGEFRIGYIIEKNFVFGKNRIILDLFRGIISKYNIKRTVKKVTLKPITQKTVKEYISKSKKIRKYYGKVGNKRREVIISPILKKDKVIYIATDKKTGKFLKPIGEAKKRIEELNKNRKI